MYVHVCTCFRLYKCSVWIYELGVTVGYKTEEHHNCLPIDWPSFVILKLERHKRTACDHKRLDFDRVLWR